ncbi:unnamed protein product [Didymodactylos carnosus]|uniref:HECT-type E3 ubiquitin transferase n=1 Tax=Didymodactylos carnosus TaxID=1234261 RepID=A0A814M5F5_9BILA|nr:unnamed protein product [Didymodactylos carnosus]CAF1073002.1 unnamed protein product [Didymodactylos carnosus]CAF3651381.1 unnamed protein product [Didymodactylos carnosus]CAF3839931.1 unnamed protein product [Didymodactylos carnosus]
MKKFFAMSNNEQRGKIYGADVTERNARLLRVRVFRASDLQRKDLFGSSPGDPYVKISLQTPDNRGQTVDITKDEFLGMCYAELNNNIPVEIPDVPIVAKEYQLLKRSVLQRVRGNVMIGLQYISPNAPRQNAEAEIENNVPPLPPGWEERKDAQQRTYYVDHNTRSTTWFRPNRNPNVPPVPQRPDIGFRRQIDDIDTNRANAPQPSATPDASPMTTRGAAVDDLGPMPPGWQISKSGTDRVFFIDHINKCTTWIDPRTGKPSPVKNWEMRTMPDGRVYYIDHETRTTTWIDPRVAGPAVPYSRDYQSKYQQLKRTLPKPKPYVGNQFEIHVSRKEILETSFRSIMVVKDVEVFKARLWVIFDGERGLDYGGLSREWFLLLSREMFNPYYGLFEYSAIDNYTLQVNSASGLLNEDHIKYFRFIGRIIGMAVYHGKLLEAFFIRPFYKMLLGKSITLMDMETVDREYYQSLKYIVENDPTDLDLYFVVNEEILGDLREQELKPNGQHIQVTEQNKHEYVELVIHYRFVRRVEAQMNALKQGFQDIIPLDTIKIFDEKEVELLISGLGEINLNDWRTHTMYKGGYTPDNPVIQWFWQALSTFNMEERTRLLQFVTGTSRLPMNGFRELWGSSGPQLFTIEKWGDKTKLPRAHTCFNRIDLPPYDNYKDLQQKLIQAMEMSEAFEDIKIVFDDCCYFKLMSLSKAIAFTILPHLGGLIGGYITRSSIKEWYETLDRPNWRPPNWAFPPVWTTLYTFMGISSYLIWRDGIGQERQIALALYGSQLLLNWLWTPIFFGQHKLGLACAEITLLLLNIGGCLITFYPINQVAFGLMLPYFGWVSLATALTYSIWFRNKDKISDRTTRRQD